MRNLDSRIVKIQKIMGVRNLIKMFWLINWDLKKNMPNFLTELVVDYQ